MGTEVHQLQTTSSFTEQRAQWVSVTGRCYVELYLPLLVTIQHYKTDVHYAIIHYNRW